MVDSCSADCPSNCAASGICTWCISWTYSNKVQSRMPPWILDCWVLPVGENWHCRRVAREELLRLVEENVMASTMRADDCGVMMSTIPILREWQTFRTGWQSRMMLTRFITSESLLSSDTLRQALSTRYIIPDYFWTDAFQRYNGFFGCQDIYNEEGKLKTHSIDMPWSRPHRLLLTLDHSHMLPLYSKAGEAPISTYTNGMRLGSLRDGRQKVDIFCFALTFLWYYVIVLKASFSRPR